MSLAEELRADLEEEDDDETLRQDIDRKTDQEFKLPGLPPSDQSTSDASNQIGSVKQSLHEVAKLHTSHRYVSTMAKIEQYALQDVSDYDLSCPTDANPEYHLIVDANNLVADIDDEIVKVHKYTKEVYSKRFPELETLVAQPVDYLRTASELGNKVLRAKNNSVLEQFLTQATIMVVSVTASTTQGVDLSDSEIETVRESSDLVTSLLEARNKILLYVESRMTYVAPNLSAVVGSTIAAQLLGAAGGLSALCKMPASHLALLGQDKRSQESGFALQKSAASHLPHCGYIFHCSFVQSVPVDLRRKVVRIVGDKCMLAARVDLQRTAASHSAESGQDFRLQLEKKIDKFMEPSQVKATRALPVPLEAPKKKRGGRRVRRQKERYAVSEMRRQANRMNFAEIEEDVVQTDLGFSRGNIGKGGTGSSGSLRAIQVDERTKVKVSQTLKRNLQKQQASWGGLTSVRKQISGTASSVAFTPLQGLEIVNPNAAEAMTESNMGNKYFSSSASFVKRSTA